MRDLLCLFFILLKSKYSYGGFEPFIVGGSMADIFKAPHVAYMSVRCELTWICGASIVNQRTLLTAAHCLGHCEAYTRDEIEILAGHENIKKATISRLVENFKVHSKYSEITLDNDIALLLLASDLPLGKTVKRVIISKNYLGKIKEAIVAGWGIVNEESGKTSIFLKQVGTKLRSKKICTKMGEMTPGMFCAGSAKIGVDHPSKGDSGSALITDEAYQIGLVSFRTTQYPSLLAYTNVTYYYKWIMSHAKKLYCHRKKKKGK